MGMSRMVLVGSGRMRDADLGVVHYVVRSQAKRFTARWKTGELQLTVPPSVSEQEFYHALAEMKPRLLQRRPASGKYYFGQTIDAGEFRVFIESIETNSGRIQARRANGGWMLYVPESFNLSDFEVVRGISNVLRRIAGVEAPSILVPRARKLADEVGRHPVGWTISKGQRTLGRCDSRGYIALSSLLVYYPQEIRDYVIYHELAHLSEMNHSPRFHELCDRYCRGRERELIARLKAYKLPL
ncbi:MAG: M48 family metallopeptidase [Muribaculaceae bacterium]|nr:M48 family metallopeptidase [Muribaculaceae bacterium]